LLVWVKVPQIAPETREVLLRHPGRLPGRGAIYQR
jgi:hypothetical protein